MRMVAPSIIAGDWGCLGDEARRLEQAGADWLHLDVMDGNFVPNITFGPDVVRMARAAVGITLDAHLMISDPDAYFPRFVEAGADIVSIHIEVRPEPASILQAVRSLGAKAGLVINPPTPFERVEPYLGDIDLLLVMSVNPGFAGQRFMGEVLPKVELAHAWREREGADFKIEVDGGVNAETAGRIWAAGADVVVAGAAVLRAPDYRRAMEEIRRA